jgi:hypothetical protein
MNCKICKSSENYVFSKSHYLRDICIYCYGVTPSYIPHKQVRKFLESKLKQDGKNDL